MKLGFEPIRQPFIPNKTSNNSNTSLKNNIAFGSKTGAISKFNKPVINGPITNDINNITAKHPKIFKNEFESLEFFKQYNIKLTNEEYFKFRSLFGRGRKLRHSINKNGHELTVLRFKKANEENYTPVFIETGQKTYKTLQSTNKNPYEAIKSLIDLSEKGKHTDINILKS